MPTKNRFAGLIAAAALLLAGRAAAGELETLTYTLTPQPATGGIKVEFTWQTAGRNRSLVGVSPRWGAVDNVPALLGEVAFDGATARRDGPRWLLEHRQGATITCQYEVRTKKRGFDWNTTHHPIATADFFHGMGNAFLIVPESGGSVPREFEVLLRWKVPADWKAACSWSVGKAVGATIAATDLRHSVYLAGDLTIKSAQQDGRSVSVALVDRFAFDADEFLKMAETIIAQQCAYMGDTKFSDFVVTAIPVGQALAEGESRLAGAGLYRSFALFVAPKAKLTEAVEHLFAHELFHYWNGRVLGAAKPEELVYWFTEGFTDYYALKILLQGGYWKPAQYAKWLNRHIREYHANPAMHASNEEIQKGFWKQRDTVGEVAYQRGLLLALRWDALARERGVREGVDKLFKTLVQRARDTGLELSNDVIRRAGVELLGEWFGADFDRYVVAAETVEVPTAALAPTFNGRVRTVYEYQLGFDREKSLKAERVIGLVAGSAADKAGLKEGDELAGYSLYVDPERQTEIKVRRGGKVQTIRYYPRGAGREVLQFEASARGKSENDK